VSQGALFGPQRRPPKERPRDEVWDTLTELFGEATTRRTRGRRNAAAKELREANATPEEIRLTYDYCRRYFGYFTEMAICMYHGRALHEQRSSSAGGNIIQLAFQRRQAGT
jgi:hypothetical protein